MTETTQTKNRKVFFFVADPGKEKIPGYSFTKVLPPGPVIKVGEPGYEPIKPRPPVNIFFSAGDESDFNLTHFAAWIAANVSIDVRADYDGNHSLMDIDTETKSAVFLGTGNDEVTVDMMQLVVAAVRKYQPPHPGARVKKVAENDEVVLYALVLSDMFYFSKFELDHEHGIDAGPWKSNSGLYYASEGKKTNYGVYANPLTEYFINMLSEEKSKD